LRGQVELFTQIKRVLEPGAPVLFTVSAGPPGEGVEEDWLGAKMYWSSFSPEWYEVTLRDLGFEQSMKFKVESEFLGEVESTWFMLYQIPSSSRSARVRDTPFHFSPEFHGLSSV
jgi:hypothetical protein